MTMMFVWKKSLYQLSWEIISHVKYIRLKIIKSIVEKRKFHFATDYFNEACCVSRDREVAREEIELHYGEENQ